jgi:hypothetical protein
LRPPRRKPVLTAIAKARAWIEDLTGGRVASFADIAKREGKVERHIRLLALLAFVSPAIVTDIADGLAPPLGVTKFANRLAYAWSEQRLRINFNAARSLFRPSVISLITSASCPRLT